MPLNPRSPKHESAIRIFSFFEIYYLRYYFGQPTYRYWYVYIAEFMVPATSGCWRLLLQQSSNWQWPGRLHTAAPLQYREDYERLGISANASQEEIKAAYFEKAKALHPDSSSTDCKTDTAFYELNEAYRRLIYESKLGSASFDETDPRSDPRCPEYWDIRRRRQDPHKVKLEQEMENKAREKERALIRKAGLGLVLGVFFGTIFPALFIGESDYSNGLLASGCQCDNCLLERLRRQPRGMSSHLSRSSREAGTSTQPCTRPS